MDLGRDGAQLVPAAFTGAEIDGLRALLSPVSTSTRLAPMSGLSTLLESADAIARALLPGARAVSAKFFDKSEASNWSLGWHQDRTIAVAARADVASFTNWTVKGGIVHCVPPFHYLAHMLTLRIHLDPVDADNAPLLIAPGSHRLGAVAEADVSAAVERCGIHPCLAQVGNVWIYATPILHASGRAKRPTRRRVLQLAYSADSLPPPLEWVGVEK